MVFQIGSEPITAASWLSWAQVATIRRIRQLGGDSLIGRSHAGIIMRVDAVVRYRKSGAINGELHTVPVPRHCATVLMTISEIRTPPASLENRLISTPNVRLRSSRICRILQYSQPPPLDSRILDVLDLE